jgi:hypothetical protein
MSSDGGALLLQRTNRRLNLLARAAACFQDRRKPWLVKHRVEEMLAQRVYGLALGYEDLSDHDQLRQDPLLALVSGKQQVGEEPLAGKSTLNRVELSTAQPSRYKKVHCQREALDELLTAVFVEAHPEPPERIVLDLDVTDLPLHGHQEGRFFHGFYDSYCYLPLYIFSGEHLLCARLRTAGQDASAGSTEEVERIVKQIRQAWPQVRIMVRADSGFCRDELMKWCEKNKVDYVLGMARNERLRGLIEEEMAEATRLYEQTKQPARVFAEFSYRTHKSWSRQRRVVAKAEQLEGKENPRFVVTSLQAQDWPAQRLYEELYCQRGEMENRIKAVDAVCGAGERRDTGGQPGAVISVGLGVRVGARTAAVGAAGNRVGAGAGDHDSAAAVEDRSAYPDHNPQGVDLAAVELSTAKGLCACLGAVAQLRARGRNSRFQQTNRNAGKRIFRSGPVGSVPKSVCGRSGGLRKPVLGANSPRWFRNTPLHAHSGLRYPAFPRIVMVCERCRLARFSQCASTAQIASGGRTHSSSCW